MSETMAELPGMTVTAAAPAGAQGVPEGAAAQELGVAAPSLRRPRVAARLNGVALDLLLKDVKWENNRYHEADTFSISLRMDEGPDSAASPNALASMDEMAVQILAGEGEADTLMFDGLADDVELDYERREIRLSGRDRTATLIERRTTEKWPNRTASEIATEIATNAGLTPVVTRTSTRVGTYYEREHARLADDVSEWTLLTYLAEAEGFDVYVRGRELHFGPPAEEASAPRWALRYVPPDADVPYAEAPTPSLILRRSLTVARDIRVIVISWNSRQAKAITAEARSAPRRGVRGRGPTGQRNDLPTQTFVLRRPGLTLEQATQLAQQSLRDFSRHERNVVAQRIPADVRLTPEHLLVVSGTDTTFDQSYRLDAINWLYGVGEGFTMLLRARNLAPQASAAL